MGGRFFSIFDCKVEYKIGQMMQQNARVGHQGGYYVYSTI